MADEQISMDAHALLESLTKEPEAFYKSGRANALLKEYFSGLPIDTLDVLLHSKNHDGLRSAIWIASELGSKAVPVVPSVFPLLNSPDAYVATYALEVIVVCGSAGDAKVVQAIENALLSENRIIRFNAMRLLANVDSDFYGKVLSGIIARADDVIRPMLLQMKKADKANLPVDLLSSDIRLVWVMAAIAIKRNTRSYLISEQVKKDNVLNGDLERYFNLPVFGKDI